MGDDRDPPIDKASIPLDDEPWYMKPQPKGVTPATTPGIAQSKPFKELATDQARQVITRAVRWGVFQGLLLFALLSFALGLAWVFITYAAGMPLNLE